MDASCQCGAIRLKTPTPEPLSLYHCHCLDCRAQSGSAFGTSAIFPNIELPPASDDFPIAVYTRNTDSGGVMDCYFCSKCGVRVMHRRRGWDAVSVKGGLLKGLDWTSGGKGGIHIFVRSAVVPIPEGAEAYETEPPLR